MGLFGSDSEDTKQNFEDIPYAPDYVSRNKNTLTGARDLRRKAEGDIEEGKISQMDIKRTLSSYLQPNEQPHYIFEHSSKGLRIEHPELENRKTPHNSGYQGRRYLIVTDRRLLFIGGRPSDDITRNRQGHPGEEDTVIEFPYPEINEVTDSFGGILSSSGIRFSFREDWTITFFSNKNSKHISDAVKYIRSQIGNSTKPNRFFKKGVKLESEADSLVENGKYEEAIERYTESLSAFKKLKEIAPKERAIDSNEIREKINQVQNSREQIVEKRTANEESSHQRQKDERNCEICGKNSKSVDKAEVNGVDIDICHICKQMTLYSDDNSYEYENEETNYSTINKYNSISEESGDVTSSPQREEKNIVEKSEKVKSEIQRKVSSLRSDLTDIDTLVSEKKLEKALKRLDNVEAQLDSLIQDYSGESDIDEIDDFRKSVDKKREEIEQKIETQEREKEVRERIQSIRSDLAKVDSLATDAEFQQANQLLDEIDSRITELKQDASQIGLGTLETEIRRLEQECDNRLSKPDVLSQLREMDPYEFEKLVAKIWEKQGWNAEATSGSADRGVDVVATKEDTFEKRRHLIQVKRHGENTTVGSEDIQRYASLYQRDEQVDNVFVVTSNRFTSEAKEVAKGRDVSTVNGDELYEMLTET